MKEMSETGGINFRGKVAIVTGGAMGIGEATARTFCELGARVAVLDRDEQQGRAAVQRLAEAGCSATFHACDVAKLADVESAVSEAARSSQRFR